MALTYLGTKLNVDIYLAAIIVFVGRIFTDMAIIRRYYIDKWSRKRIVAKSTATVEKQKKE